jgi:hypothetical protein
MRLQALVFTFCLRLIPCLVCYRGALLAAQTLLGASLHGVRHLPHQFTRAQVAWILLIRNEVREHLGGEMRTDVVRWQPQYEREDVRVGRYCVIHPAGALHRVEKSPLAYGQRKILGTRQIIGGIDLVRRGASLPDVNHGPPLLGHDNGSGFEPLVQISGPITHEATNLDVGDGVAPRNPIAP